MTLQQPIHDKNGLVNHIPSQEKGNMSELKDGKMLPKKKKKWKWRKNKKRTSKPAISDCDNAKATPTNQQVKRKLDENSETPQPAKKKRKKKKKKMTGNENSSEGAVGFKPVFIIRKPEDYSANWKQLKEVITQGDKKRSTETRCPEKNKERSMNEWKHKSGNIKKNKEIEKGNNHATNKEKTRDVKKKKEKLEVWFDNVDPILLVDGEDTDIENVKEETHHEKDKAGNTSALVKTKSFEGLTKVIAMDCEMVGTGMNGEDSILARVSIVNHFGKMLYDKFVKPTEVVTDYRTKVSGIRPADLEKGCEFSTAQKEVSEILEGRVLVGHSVRNDLRVLFLSHPRCHTRDTSRYKGFRRLFGGKTPSLKKLTEKVLGVQIQHGEHSSVQDAQAAMRLYTMNRREWEQFFSKKQRKLTSKKKKIKAPAAQTEKENTEEAET